MKKRFFRVCHKDTLQGLWYDYQGRFTGLIHDEFSFCENSDLKMDFDPDLVGWLSAVETIETLFNWFTKEDIKQLENKGWFIHEFETSTYRFYDKFQHILIDQNDSVVIRMINIDEL
jgi:hypothetical protein